MSFDTFQNWFFGKLDKFSVDVQQAWRTLAQHIVDDGDPRFYQASAT